MNGAWGARLGSHERAAGAGARVAVQRALRLDPTSYEARFSAASLFTGTGEKENLEHEKELRILLHERPDDKRVLRALASVLRYLPNRENEVIRLYDRAAQLPGGDPWHCTTRRWRSGLWGRAKEAEVAVTASLAQQPFRWAPGFSARSLPSWWTGIWTARRPCWNSCPPRRCRTIAGAISPTWFTPIAANRTRRSRSSSPFPATGSIGDNWFRGPRSLLTGNALAQAGRPDAAAVEWRAALKVVEPRLAANPNDLVNLLESTGCCCSPGSVRLAAASAIAARRCAKCWKPRRMASWMRRLVPAGVPGDGRPGGSVARRPGSDCSQIGTACDLHYGIGPCVHNPTWASSLRGDPEFQRLIAEADRLEQRPMRAGAATVAHRRRSCSVRWTTNPLAVLWRFANLSDDKANEYFSDGISEELLNVLAKVPGLKVTARTSSFYFKGKEVPVPEIAKQLGVAYVVEGSVRKQGDKVRITAQLIKAADGFHVWSDTFTRDLKDVFAVQDEIAGLKIRQPAFRSRWGSGRARRRPA